MKANKHSKVIPKNIRNMVQTKILEALELLEPYKLALTPKERRGIPKMGTKNLTFVKKALEFAHENPRLVPPYLEMAAFDVDFEDASELWVLKNHIDQLNHCVASIQMASGSEAYQSALSFYGSSKVAISQGVPGAETVYRELREAFPGLRKPKNKTSTE